MYTGYWKKIKKYLTGLCPLPYIIFSYFVEHCNLTRENYLQKLYCTYIYSVEMLVAQQLQPLKFTRVSIYHSDAVIYRCWNVCYGALTMNKPTLAGSAEPVNGTYHISQRGWKAQHACWHLLTYPCYTSHFIILVLDALCKIVVSTCRLTSITRYCKLHCQSNDACTACFWCLHICMHCVGQPQEMTNPQ